MRQPVRWATGSSATRRFRSSRSRWMRSIKSTMSGMRADSTAASGRPRRPRFRTGSELRCLQRSRAPAPARAAVGRTRGAEGRKELHERLCETEEAGQEEGPEDAQGAAQREARRRRELPPRHPALSSRGGGEHDEGSTMFTKILERRRMKRLLARDPATLDSGERDELRFLQDKHGEAGAADARAA